MTLSDMHFGLESRCWKKSKNRGPRRCDKSQIDLGKGSPLDEVLKHPKVVYLVTYKRTSATSVQP